jgi:hypothetical protein
LSFNLAAHIHSIGPEPPSGGGGQTTKVYQQGLNLTLPADVTAAGFYITNVHNNIVGNAASGVRTHRMNCCFVEFVLIPLLTSILVLCRGGLDLHSPFSRQLSKASVMRYSGHRLLLALQLMETRHIPLDGGGGTRAPFTSAVPCTTTTASWSITLDEVLTIIGVRAK